MKKLSWFNRSRLAKKFSFLPIVCAAVLFTALPAFPDGNQKLAAQGVENQNLKELLQELGSRDPKVRQNAVAALGELGRKDKAVVPALINSLLDPKVIEEVLLTSGVGVPVGPGKGEKTPPKAAQAFPWQNKDYLKITGIPDIVSSISFSPDEKVLAFSTHNGHVRFWDLEQKKSLAKEIRTDTAMPQMQISPSGKYFLTVEKGLDTSHLILWDFASKEKIWESNDFHRNHISNAIFVPGSDKIAATDFFNLRILNVGSNKTVSTYSIDRGFLSYVDASKDGKAIYVAGHAFQKFNVFRSGQKEVKHLDDKSFGISALLVLREHNAVLLGAGGGKRLLLYRGQMASEILQPMSGRVMSLASSADEQWLAVCDHTSLSVWRFDDQREYLRLEDLVPSLTVFSPSGTYFAIGYGASHISIWKK